MSRDAGSEVHHVAGPHQHDVARLDGDVWASSHAASRSPGMIGYPGSSTSRPRARATSSRTPRLTTVVRRWMPQRAAPAAETVDAG